MTDSSNLPLAEIRSLTGLRFWAAFFILLNHLLLGLVSRNDPYFGTMLVASGFLGMDIFFILSGFIIHYNYHRKLQDFRFSSFFDFLIARFARLYPLYIVLLFLEYFTRNTSSAWGKEAYIPFFLTMSQSWFFSQTSAGALLPHVFPRISIAWSISTEFLMYCGYPAILWLLLRDNLSHGTRIITALTVCVVCSLFLGSLYTYPDYADKVGIYLFGPQAGMANNIEHSFVLWLRFFSPYIRFLEFIIGAIVAHVFLQMRSIPAGKAERLIMSWVGLLALGYILMTFLPKPYQPHFVGTVFNLVGSYLFVATIVFICARYEFGVITKALSFWIFVFLGECSYSIYLFHIFIYGAMDQSPASGFMLVLRILVLWATVFACAYVLYRLIEMPARRWLRATLSGWLFSNRMAPEPLRDASVQLK